MRPPEVGQYYKGRYHHKVIQVLEVHPDAEGYSTIMAKLVIAGGGGQTWTVQWVTLKKSYKLLDEYQETEDHLLTCPGMGAKLNIP